MQLILISDVKILVVCGVIFLPEIRINQITRIRSDSESDLFLYIGNF